ncbi:hypothetical protein CR513_04193, partial [Mucuna pruriens]
MKELGKLKYFLRIKIAYSKQVQHDKTKHIKTNRDFIKEKLNNGLVVTTHVPIGLQVANVFTKGLPTTRFQELNGKLRMIDIHLPTKGKFFYMDPLFYFHMECIFLKMKEIPSSLEHYSSEVISRATNLQTSKLENLCGYGKYFLYRTLPSFLLDDIYSLDSEFFFGRTK